MTIGITYWETSFHQTIDGGYIGAGWIQLDDPIGGPIGPVITAKSLLVKLDEEGNIKWQKTYQDQQTFLGGHQTPDGGYITSGLYVTFLKNNTS